MGDQRPFLREKGHVGRRVAGANERDATGTFTRMTGFLVTRGTACESGGVFHMKNVRKLAVVAAAALGLAACEGRADENLAASAENIAGDVGNLAEDAANGAVNVANDVGSAVGNGVDAAGNSLDENNSGNAAATNTAVNTTTTGNAQ
jgi:hypothetical protein